MFPIQGGVFNAVNKRIRKPEGVPVVLETRICIKSCSASHDISNEAGNDFDNNNHENKETNVESEPEPERGPELKPEIGVKEDKKSTNEYDNDEKDKRKDEDDVNIGFGDEEKHENGHDHHHDYGHDHSGHDHNHHDHDNNDEEENLTKHQTNNQGKRNDMTNILKSKKNDGKGDDNSVEVEFKLSNIWKPSLNEKDSVDYKKLMNNVQKQFETELKRRHQTDNKIEMKNLTKIDNNGALATVKLDIINSTKLKSKASRNIALSQVKKAIKEAINNGQVGNLKVDPSYLIFKSPGKFDDLFLNQLELN